MGASVGCLTTTLGSFLILFSRLCAITITTIIQNLMLKESKVKGNVAKESTRIQGLLENLIEFRGNREKRFNLCFGEEKSTLEREN